MEINKQNASPILQVAWNKFAQYDDTSVKRTAAFLRLRRWIAILGVLATLFAILTAMYPKTLPASGQLILKAILIASPIVASMLAAYANEYFSTGDWLVARAGAEEVLKNIYLYRTILKSHPNRREWLKNRLANTQRSVYHGMNGELVLEPYKGNLPPSPRFNPNDPNSDDGFSDLTGSQYFKFRLENELNWHIKKINQKQKERTRLQWMIYISGAAGAILAAMGGGLTIWVALAASLTAAFLGWQQLKNLELVVRNYSKVIMELNIIADHWNNLEAEERTHTEVYRMVESTENILWSRNVEYIKSMQEALKESNLDKESSLINRVIEEQREADRRFKKSVEDAVVGYTAETLEKATDTMSDTFEEALGTLSEEASSEIVQAELAAIKEAAGDFMENVAQKMGLSSSLKSISEDFDDVEISGDTPRGVLNDLLARYPKTSEVKG